MGLRVEAAADELPLDVCVPVVFYFVVGSSRQSPRNQRPLVSKQAMELDDELIFFFCEISTLEVRAKVVYPSQPTALAAPKQPCGFGEGAPAAFAMDADVIDEALVFFFGPSAFVGVSFLTAR